MSKFNKKEFNCEILSFGTYKLLLVSTNENDHCHQLWADQFVKL